MPSNPETTAVPCDDAEVMRRCVAITLAGTQCTRSQDGRGTLLCEQHHYAKFARSQHTDANGCIAGRPGYGGHHGHLNR